MKLEMMQMTSSVLLTTYRSFGLNETHIIIYDTQLYETVPFSQKQYETADIKSPRILTSR